MPKVRYHCEYCDQPYNTWDEAVECEDRGLPNEPKFKEADQFGRLGKIRILSIKIILKRNKGSDQPHHMIGYNVQHPTRLSWLSEAALEREGLYRRGM